MMMMTSVSMWCLFLIQMQIASLLQLTTVKVDARHLQSVTQQLSQATGEIQTLASQLHASQLETVSCCSSSSFLLISSGMIIIITSFWLITKFIGHCCTVFTRNSIYAIARICYRLSVRPSVRRVDHRKSVEVKIMKFSPYGSPIPLVFAG